MLVVSGTLLHTIDSSRLAPELVPLDGWLTPVGVQAVMITLIPRTINIDLFFIIKNIDYCVLALCELPHIKPKPLVFQSILYQQHISFAKYKHSKLLMD